ncbi:MAG: hypothetical protein IJO32_03180 [Bacilli bacterium]|nr:hypothetical protein [Bacilli bacterium]MBQ7140484.1 hypothetical protein [Bacilli bacterium]
MKKIFKIIIPSILMLLLIYLWRSGKDILTGIYIVFPIIYIMVGIICSESLVELIISLFLLSVSFLIPINLMFNMGNCIDLVIIYNVLSFLSLLLKKKIGKKYKFFDFLKK